MARIKLSGGDLRRDEVPTAEVMEMAFSAFAGVNAVARVGASPGEGVPLKGGTVVEGLYALAAMVIDAMPEVRTHGDRRAMAQDAADRILDYLKQFHRLYETSGEHAIETFAPVLTPPRGKMQ